MSVSEAGAVAPSVEANGVDGDGDGDGGTGRASRPNRPGRDNRPDRPGRTVALPRVVEGPTERLLLKVEEAASATGWSRAFIYEAIQAGDLRVVRYGRTTRIRPSDLQAFIDALVVTGAA